jgi:hypothetical protein
LLTPKNMLASTDRRLWASAEELVRTTSGRVRLEAAAARACLEHGSPHGVRHHLRSLHELAERQARVERHLLRRSSAAPRLVRAAAAALRALDSGSPAQLVRALERVAAMTGAQ